MLKLSESNVKQNWTSTTYRIHLNQCRPKQELGIKLILLKICAVLSSDKYNFNSNKVDSNAVTGYRY